MDFWLSRGLSIFTPSNTRAIQQNFGDVRLGFWADTLLHTMFLLDVNVSLRKSWFLGSSVLLFISATGVVSLLVSSSYDTGSGEHSPEIRNSDTYQTWGYGLFDFRKRVRNYRSWRKMRPDWSFLVKCVCIIHAHMCIPNSDFIHTHTHTQTHTFNWKATAVGWATTPLCLFKEKEFTWQ